MGETGVGSAYERLLADLDLGYREESLRELRNGLGADQMLDQPGSVVAAVAKGYELIINASATSRRFSVGFEALERISGNANVSTPQYVPLVFTHREKLTGHDKMIAAFYAVVLADVVGSLPIHQ